MIRCCIALLLAAATVCLSTAQDKKDPPKQAAPTVFTNAGEAGPDFKIQGEYEGKLGNDKYGVQIVALGDGKFDIWFLTGGLPGAGWDAKARVKADAKSENDKVILTGKWTGTIGDGKLAGKSPESVEFSLGKVERKSPTMGLKPPEAAIVLFDGKNADEWNGGKIVEDNLLNCGVTSKKGITTGKLHLEFRTPFQPKARGQGRGNSGCYIHGMEIQVLDSFGLKGENNECGGFYGHRKPDVNMCLPPLSWQTYDVDIKVDSENIVATVWHNGVKVHENFILKKGPLKPATINLQNHGNPVVYRNIWFAEMK
jgi:3-keto-disaccharide hydrolase